MVIDSISSINELNKYIIDFTLSNYESNWLYPIVWGWKKINPDIMFVFINPTKNNLGTKKNREGQRVPWIWYTTLWDVLHEAWFINDYWMNQLEDKKGKWDAEFTEKLYKYLEEEQLYLTNIVKKAEIDARLPQSKLIKDYSDIFFKEIELVNPKKIVVFGKIPMSVFMSSSIALKECYRYLEEKWKLRTVNFNNKEVIPCYFPVWLGRRNKPQAVDILKKLSEDNPK